ncbi:MAG: hypothetical protein V4619_01650 [Bacteroidota bacterium]
MKSILILLLSLLYLTSFGQFTNDDYAGAKAKGQVRSTVTEGYNRADSTDKLFTHLWMVRKQDYNKKGQLVKLTSSYDLRGSDIHEEFVNTYSYDLKGNLQNIVLHYANGKTAEKKTFSFVTPRFIIVQQHLYNGDTSRESIQLRLDRFNRKIEEHNYGSYTDTSVMAYNGVTYFKYDKRGYRILKSTHHPDGERRFYTITTYNKNGDIIEFTDYAGTPARPLFTGRHKYTKYDSHHNWIKSVNVMSNGKSNGRFVRTLTYYK